VLISGTGLCDGLITCPEESYRMWCVSECDRKASRVRKPCSTMGCQVMKKNFIFPLSILIPRMLHIHLLSSACI